MAALPDALSLLLVPGAAIAVLAGVVSTWLLRWLAGLGRRTADGGLWSWVDDTSELVKLGLRADTNDEWWRIGAALAGLGAVGAASVFIWRAAVLGAAAEASDWYALVMFLVFPAGVLVACFGWPGFDRTSSAPTGLLTTYLLALSLALFVPVLRAGALSLGQLLAAHGSAGPVAFSASGGLGFLAAVAATRAALSLVPGPGGSPLVESVGATTALLAQCLRAGWLYACVLSIALLFGSVAGAGGSGAALLLVEYLVLLLVLAALYEGISRWGAERILVSGALPTLLLAGIAFGLALGG
ncbi:MAG: hypothetical protein ACYC7H_13820, partial [Chloroflexota bacterium]